MITLISKWKLRNGVPPELAKALHEVATIVKAKEPDTLAYSVHLSSALPLDAHSQPLHPSPAAAPHDLQTEVIFFEIYADANAFAAHVNGPVFTRFRKENIHHFYQDPDRPGWPNTETSFFERQSAFFRSCAN